MDTWEGYGIVPQVTPAGAFETQLSSSLSMLFFPVPSFLGRWSTPRKWASEALLFHFPWHWQSPEDHRASQDMLVVMNSESWREQVRRRIRRNRNCSALLLVRGFVHQTGPSDLDPCCKASLRDPSSRYASTLLLSSFRLVRSLSLSLSLSLPLSLSLSLSHTHTHTHARTHARTLPLSLSPSSFFFLPPSPPFSLVHVHPHTHPRTQAHTCTHTLPSLLFPFSLIHAHAHTHAHTHTSSFFDTHAHTHTHTHAHAHSHSLSLSLSPSPFFFLPPSPPFSLVHVHPHTHPRTHARTHMHTLSPPSSFPSLSYMRMLTRTHAHTHTHTHTHTLSLSLSLSLSLCSHSRAHVLHLFTILFSFFFLFRFDGHLLWLNMHESC